MPKPSTELLALAAIYKKHGARKVLDALNVIAVKNGEKMVVHLGSEGNIIETDYGGILHLLSVCEEHETPVHIQYRKVSRPSGLPPEVVTRIIEYPKLRKQGGILYLTGYDRMREAFRRFRVDHIMKAKVIQDSHGR